MMDRWRADGQTGGQMDRLIDEWIYKKRKYNSNLQYHSFTKKENLAIMLTEISQRQGQMPFDST